MDGDADPVLAGRVAAVAGKVVPPRPLTSRPNEITHSHSAVGDVAIRNRGQLGAICGLVDSWQRQLTLLLPAGTINQVFMSPRSLETENDSAMIRRQRETTHAHAQNPVHRTVSR